MVEVRTVETFAELLEAVRAGDDGSTFHNRLCEATCQLAEMERAAAFVYDKSEGRVRAVGSHGVTIEAFLDWHIEIDEAPFALRTLSENRVIEATEGFAQLLPPEAEPFLAGARLVCTPISAAGVWRGVIVSHRPVDQPLTEAERHALWSLGKIAALADSARSVTREQLHAKHLQDRIDLAREIHDGAIQRLFGVGMALAGDTLTDADRQRCADEVQGALHELRFALERPLRPGSAAAPACPVAPDRPADADIEPLAQAVLAEALRNALKHAEPTHVDVRIDRCAGRLSLEVINDGVATTPRPQSGMGLRLAEIEASQRGGRLDAGPADAGAWRLLLDVPEGSVR